MDTSHNYSYKDWKVVRLEEITTQFISGGTPSTSNPEYWDGNIPWMKSAWITRGFVDSGEKHITKKGLMNSAANIVPQGNILVATRVCIGNVAINKIDIAISQDLTGVIIDKEKAYPEFVYWALKNSESRVRQLVQGSTIKGILREDLKKIRIFLPPIAEQQKISSVLQCMNNTIEKTKDLVEKYRKIKQGLMQNLFSKGITENNRSHTDFVDSELGRIPVGWRVMKLGEVSRISYGISDPIDITLREGIPLISLRNINLDGQLSLEEVFFIEEKKVLKKHLLKKGDLLFNWRSGSIEHLGKTTFFDLNGAYTHVGFLLKIRTKKGKADPRFIFEYLTYLRQIGFFKTSKMQVNRTFNSSELRNLLIALPDLQEQIRIVRILSTIDNKSQSEKNYLDKLVKIKTGLVQDLLTGRTRVRVAG